MLRRTIYLVSILITSWLLKLLTAEFPKFLWIGLLIVVIHSLDFWALGAWARRLKLLFSMLGVLGLLSGVIFLSHHFSELSEAGDYAYNIVFLDWGSRLGNFLFSLILIVVVAIAVFIIVHFTEKTEDFGALSVVLFPVTIFLLMLCPFVLCNLPLLLINLFIKLYNAIRFPGLVFYLFLVEVDFLIIRQLILGSLYLFGENAQFVAI